MLVRLIWAFSLLLRTLLEMDLKPKDIMTRQVG